MDTNTDLKELWSRQSGPMPDSREIFNKVRQYKKKHMLMLIRTNVLLVLTSIFIIWVVYNYKPHHIFSTKIIGTVLVISAMAVYLAVYNRIIPLLRKIDDNRSTREYLQNLLKLKAKQKFLQTTMMNAYYILLSSGIFLYMIEPTMHMPPGGLIFTYALTFGWILFSWFYLRRRAIRKQESEMKDLIEKFEGLERQLEE